MRIDSKCIGIVLNHRVDQEIVISIIEDRAQRCCVVPSVVDPRPSQTRSKSIANHPDRMSADEHGSFLSCETILVHHFRLYLATRGGATASNAAATC